MKRLYRKHPVLPSLVVALFAAALLTACDSEPPPKTTAKPIPNTYLEKLQEAEALKQTVEQRNLEQQRIDALIGRDQAVPPTR